MSESAKPVQNNTTGRIKIGKATANHDAVLKALGYEVAKEEDYFVINCSGFQKRITVESEDALVSTFREMVARKELITYRTRVTIADRTLFGVPLCGYLEQLATGLSAIVVAQSEHNRPTAVNLLS